MILVLVALRHKGIYRGPFVHASGVWLATLEAEARLQHSAAT